MKVLVTPKLVENSVTYVGRRRQFERPSGNGYHLTQVGWGNYSTADELGGGNGAGNHRLEHGDGVGYGNGYRDGSGEDHELPFT